MDSKAFIVKMIRESAGGAAISMKRRLLVFLLFLTFTMLAGVLLLLWFGAFPPGSGETGKLFLNELAQLSSALSKQYGGASVQAARMSERLAADIAAFMKRQGLSPLDLKKRPELLEPLLQELLPTLLNKLDATDCSGAFVTLDATVNPRIPGAENSKAGLYICNVEPNIGGTGTEMRYLLRGFPSLAGKSYINLQAKWELEFDVAGRHFWREPIAAYEADRSLPLSRLVYWRSMDSVQGLNEKVMVCSVPLLDDSGEVLGVCGFTIGRMNFMLRYEPNVGGFYNAVFMFSSDAGGGFRLEDALFSGHVAVYNEFPRQGSIDMTGSGSGGFSVYGIRGGASFVGVDKAIRLYPDDSPFAEQGYSAALIIPKADFDAAQNRTKFRLGVILLALTAIGIAASVVLSRRYVKPITDKLATAGENGLPEKTNIVEIDQLLEKIKELRPKDSPLPDNLFEDFIARVKTLTPTETDIFRYYVQAKTPGEILPLMSFGANTFKTHNKRIYKKLDVSSIDELMLYVELIKRSGLVDKILCKR